MTSSIIRANTSGRLRTPPWSRLWWVILLILRHANRILDVAAPICLGKVERPIG